MVCFSLLTATAMAKTRVEAWMYLTGKNADFMTNLAEKFEANNPDIDLEVVYVDGYYAAFDKLLVALAGGAGPNLALIEQSLAYALVTNNGAVDLTPYIDSDPTMTMQDFDPVLRQTVTFNNRMYGIPYNVSTPVLYYNKDIFALAGLSPEAPRTRETFYQTVKKTTYTAGDGKISRYGFYLTAWRWLFEAWVGRSGGRIVDDQLSKFTFDSPAVQEIMQFAQDMVNTDRIAGYSSSSSGAHKPFFASQLAMMEYTTAGLVSVETSTKANGINLGVAQLPCFKECYVPIGGANLMMINAGTKADKDATWRFLSYVASPDNLAGFSALTGYMAPRRSARSTSTFREYLRQYPYAAVTYDQVQNAHARPQLPFWNTIQEDLINVLSPSMFSKKENFRPVLTDLQTKANAMLREWQQSRK